MAAGESTDDASGTGKLQTLFSSNNWSADSTTSATLGDYLEELAEDPFLRDVAIRSLGLMRMSPGQQVLDAGCGTGVLLEALARAVGPMGHVVGLDHNADFLAEARKRVESTAVDNVIELRTGDARAMPFPDASFDASHCERLLMHLEIPGQAVTEMARVTRPGGWVVIAEPDYGALRTDHPDQEAIRAIYEASIAPLKSPKVGLEVFRLMADAGLVERTLEVLVNVETRLHPMSLPSYQYGADAAVIAGRLTRERADAAIKMIREADERGTYASYAHMCVIAGRVPDREAPGNQCWRISERG
jgi:ubiquinone/menaquinone biosynthesis C-methylase UbiE